jgi:phosphoribosylamine--glycine ligase
MKVLITGSGGREHALAWKLAQSPLVTRLYCAPGNGGTKAPCVPVPIGALEVEKLRDFAVAEGIDLVVIGPDDALALGCADVLREAGILCFGPGREAARLESSKAWAKEFMQRYGIPCAQSQTFVEEAEAVAWCRAAEYPLVIKADGLALGKGVVIVETASEAEETLRRMMRERVFGAAGERVVVEEFLQGPECSLHAFVDRGSYLLCPEAQDHKRVGEGNTGPNTGGMGTISPTGLLDEADWNTIRREILDRFVAGLEAEGLDFRGMLFPGLILTEKGPRVLEFNCRFGDPETQVLMRRLRSDLCPILLATAQGKLGEVEAEWSEETAVCVVMASGGYPGEIRRGLPIAGLEEAAADGVVVFHAGTKGEGDISVTAGGRVLGVTALGQDRADARARAYGAVEKIHFDGGFCRRDIGDFAR